MNKKAVISLGILAIATGYGGYIYTKKKQVEKIVKELKIYLKDVKSIRIKGGQLMLDLFLEIHNPTKNDLNLSTGVLIADKIRVYDKAKNKLLAFSSMKLDKLNIKSKESFYVPRIDITIPLIDGALLALEQILDNKTDFVKRLRFELDIKLFGYVHTINF